MAIDKRSREGLERLEATTRRVGKMIAPAFEDSQAGFCLLGATWGAIGWTSYLTNMDRPSVVKLLREMADKIENKIDMPPAPAGSPEAH